MHVGCANDICLFSLLTCNKACLADSDGVTPSPSQLMFHSVLTVQTCTQPLLRVHTFTIGAGQVSVCLCAGFGVPVIS